MAARLLALAAAAFLAAGPSTAAEVPRELEGLWQGTVGDLPVRVCFAQSSSAALGQYYYLSKLRLIPLEQDDAQPNAFKEGMAGGAATPRWRLGVPAAGAVTGTWAGSGRTLPIRLTRVGQPPTDWTCGDRSFHAPRLASVRIVERPAALGRLAYTRLVLDHGGRFEGTSVETFRLPGNSESVRRINAALWKPLGEGEDGWWDCISNSLQAGSFEGGEDAKLEPKLLTRRWLVVRRNIDSYCGGPHPNTDFGYDTFSRETGRKVDLLAWLNERAVAREPAGDAEAPFLVLRPAFRAFVTAGAPRPEEECRAAIADEEFWQVELRRRAFVFSPALPRVSMACGRDYAVPFARLRPYLNAQGAAYVAEIEREGAVAP